MVRVRVRLHTVREITLGLLLDAADRRILAGLSPAERDAVAAACRPDYISEPVRVWRGVSHYGGHDVDAFMVECWYARKIYELQFIGNIHVGVVVVLGPCEHSFIKAADALTLAPTFDERWVKKYLEVGGYTW